MSTPVTGRRTAKHETCPSPCPDKATGRAYTIIAWPAVSSQSIRTTAAHHRGFCTWQYQHFFLRSERCLSPFSVRLAAVSEARLMAVLISARLSPRLVPS
ncbi:hypothetical protein MRX96_019368 [Rhipicephalus microplus]